MSNDRTVYVAVCGDCCAQLPLSNTSHTCLPMLQRRMVERLELLLDSCDDGLGVLWLVRVLYHERAKMNGVGRYKDRAILARRVCGLLEPGDA